MAHASECSRMTCECPRRLAAGTVDSILGKFRAIFKGHGRLHLANPMAHPRVKAFVREEQAGLAVYPSQAVPPFFVSYVSEITCSLKGKDNLNSQSLSRLYILYYLLYIHTLLRLPYTGLFCNNANKRYKNIKSIKG